MNVFIVGRPYHLFNAINYVVQTSISGDIFIINDYARARIDYERLKTSLIFNHIYFVEEIARRPSSLLGEVLYVLERRFFPRKFINKSIMEAYPQKGDLQKYTEFFSASPGSFFLALYKINRGAKFSVIEDGASTYSGTDFLNHQSIKHKLFCMVFHEGAMNIAIDRVLVYRPEMCQTKLAKNVEALPMIDEKSSILMKAFDMVFNYKNDIYKSKFIVLSQRLKGLNCEDFDLYEFLTEIFEINGITENYCYRLHPSEEERICTRKSCCSPNELWELVCMTYVDENSVLLTINSTAAFSPYKIYGKQPVLIFLYRIIPLKGYHYEISEALVAQIRKEYTDPSRIIVPNSISEIHNALNKLGINRIGE